MIKAIVACVVLLTSALVVAALTAAMGGVAPAWSPLPSGERVRVRGESNDDVRPAFQVLSRDSIAQGNLDAPTLTPALSLGGRGGRNEKTLNSTDVAAAAPFRFAAVDIIIDTKDQPLAVYQLEFSPVPAKGDVEAGAGSRVTIVGIEGGEHEAFRAAPHYDPAAIQAQRAIIGAFNTADADKLPRGKVRVATIHVQAIASPGVHAPPLQFNVKLTVAATVDGKPIEATATTQIKGTQP